MVACPHLCVVGSSNIDLTFRTTRLPRPGETLSGHGFQLGFGGKGANQAVMAARLGARVTMVTKVGRDIFGEQTLQNYRDQGIDTTFVTTDDACPSGVAGIIVDDNACNCILVVAGANGSLTPDDVRAATPAIRQAKAVLCQLEVPMESILEAFRVSRAAGVRTILNPAPAVSLPDELLYLTDLCVPNETEAEILTGRPVTTLREAETAARAMQARGPQTVLITLGARGVLVVDGQSVEHFPAVPIQAVDPTGAGDVFIAALAVFMAEGSSLPLAVRRASGVAALSVTAPGTQTAFPSRAQADSFLRQVGIDPEESRP
jgi:ribokinase